MTERRLLLIIHKDFLLIIEKKHFKYLNMNVWLCNIQNKDIQMDNMPMKRFSTSIKEM